MYFIYIPKSWEVGHPILSDHIFYLSRQQHYVVYYITLVILFRQTEIVLKDSTAFVYLTKSEYQVILH